MERKGWGDEWESRSRMSCVVFYFRVGVASKRERLTTRIIGIATDKLSFYS